MSKEVLSIIFMHLMEIIILVKCIFLLGRSFAHLISQNLIEPSVQLQYPPQTLKICRLLRSCWVLISLPQVIIYSGEVTYYTLPRRIAPKTITPLIGYLWSLRESTKPLKFIYFFLLNKKLRWLVEVAPLLPE